MILVIGGYWGCFSQPINYSRVAVSCLHHFAATMHSEASVKMGMRTDLVTSLFERYLCSHLSKTLIFKYIQVGHLKPCLVLLKWAFKASASAYPSSETQILSDTLSLSVNVAKFYTHAL